MKPSCLFLFFIILSLFSCKENSPTKSLSQQIHEATDKGLKDWADFPIGGGINIKNVLMDAKLDSITVHNFNSVTSTNSMKMYSIVKHDSVPYFGRVDSLVNFCETNQMRLFGHALLWYYGLPKWISKTAEEKGPEWADHFLESYIDTVVTRYKGKVAAWDVVNEAFDDKTGELRKGFWLETLGPEYIEKAFRYAHKADPDALLFYNDFGQEEYPDKLEAIVKMVTEMKQRGVPIDGIGLQMHLEKATTESGLVNALKQAAATGLMVHISELDIIFHSRNKEVLQEEDITELTDSMKISQAEKYRMVAKLYRTLVPKKQQFGITFWDFNDRDTWLRNSFDSEEWPTVFDKNLDPKPAYYSFAEGLAEKIEPEH